MSRIYVYRINNREKMIDVINNNDSLRMETPVLSVNPEEGVIKLVGCKLMNYNPDIFELQFQICSKHNSSMRPYMHYPAVLDVLIRDDKDLEDYLCRHTDKLNKKIADFVNDTNEKRMTYIIGRPKSSDCINKFIVGFILIKETVEKPAKPTTPKYLHLQTSLQVSLGDKEYKSSVVDAITSPYIDVNIEVPENMDDLNVEWIDLVNRYALLEKDYENSKMYFYGNTSYLLEQACIYPDRVAIPDLGDFYIVNNYRVLQITNKKKVYEFLVPNTNKQFLDDLPIAILSSIEKICNTDHVSAENVLRETLTGIPGGNHKKLITEFHIKLEEVE